MVLKDIVKKIKSKRWVNIAFDVILSSISVLLFLSIVILTLFVILSNYKSLFSSFGIFIQDDCKFKFGEMKCSFVEIKGKDFSVKLRDISGEINLKNILNTEPIIDLKIKNLDGIYTNDLKAVPSDRIKGLFEIYIASNYISSDIDNIRLDIINIEENTNLLLKSQNLRNINNLFLTDDLDILIDKGRTKFNVKLQNTKDFGLFIYPNYIELKNGLFEYDNFKVKISNGYITEKKDIKIDGIANIKIFEQDNLKFFDIYSKFLIHYKPSEKFYAKIDGNFKDIFLKDYAKLMRGKFNLYLTGKEISSFRSKGSVKLDEAVIYDKDIGRLDIYFDLSKLGDKLSFEGNAESKITKIKFAFKDKILNIQTDRFKISSLYRFHDSLKSLDGNLKVSIDIDVYKQRIFGRLDFEHFSVMDFKNMDGSLKFDYFKDEDRLNINSILNDRYNTVLSVDGAIDKLTQKPLLNLKFDAKSIKFGNIPQLKDLQIAGEGNFSGNIYGTLDDYKLRFSGSTKIFSFKQISFHDLEVDVSYSSDDKVINILSNLPDKTLSAKIGINIGNDSTSLSFKLDNFNLLPVLPYLKEHSNIFEIVKPLMASGSVYLDIKGKDFKLNLNLPTVDISIENSTPIRSSVYGYITENSKDLLIDAFADNFFIKGYKISNLDFKSNIKDNNISYKVKFKHLTDKLNIETLIDGTYNTDSKKLNVILKANGGFSIANKRRNLDLDIQTYGSIENLYGTGQLNVDNSILNFNFKTYSSGEDRLSISFTTSDFLYSVDGYRFSIGKSVATFQIYKNNIRQINAAASFSNVSLSGKTYSLLYIKELNVSINGDRIYIPQTYFSGVIKGKIDTAEYDINKENVKINIYGDIDEKYLSEISQLLNLNGNLKFSFSYTGKLDNITKDYNLTIFGDNLKLRTAYTQNIINFKKFQIRAKNTVNFDIFGLTKSSAGDGYIKLYGNSTTDIGKVDMDIESTNMPVKYSNQFFGLLNGKMKLSLLDKNLNINSQMTITGRLKLEPNMLEAVKQSNGNDRPEILKKARLNITISTVSPLFIEGSWGKSYADIDVIITGTVEKPILNGKITIGYGKVTIMGNRYNVDFLNIKLTNNNVYVNGRLSTYVSGVNIFVNVSGPSDNLKYEFFSTPPKSKDEILTLLLIKKAPEQITSSEIFGIIGKFGQMLVPLKTAEEERGLFGTGINVNIIPSYSPVQGIVFSIYMQKYLTRRIYIGLSRPLSQYQLTNYVGWYEGGLKLTEKTSFVIKSFENKSKSAEITFTIPFDF